MRKVRASSLSSSVLLALLAVALLLKAVIPTGWMPVVHDGAVTLRLCSGWVTVPKDHPAARLQRMAMGHPDDHGGDGKDRPNAEQPCGFAAAGLASTLADPIAPPEAFAVAAAVLLFPAAVAIGHGLAAPPPPSTGPPTLP